MALLFKFFLALTIVGICYANECCNGYYDQNYNWNDPQWCSDYCCGTLSFGLSCCSNNLLQAPAENRSEYCGLLWSNGNVWTPISTFISWMGVFIACCVSCACCICCYKCCSARRDTTAAVQHQPAMMPGVNLQHITTSQQSSATDYGYDQMKY